MVGVAELELVVDVVVDEPVAEHKLSTSPAIQPYTCVCSTSI